MGKTIKFTYEQVKDIIEKEGYKLVSDTYINANTSIEVECSIGHRYMVKLGNFRTGCRCNKCSIRRHSKTLTYDFVKEQIESFNYILLSKEYKNAKSNLIIKCPENHEFEMTYDKFKGGQRCPFCRKNRCIDINYCKEYAIEHECELLTNEYLGVKSTMEFKCKRGHFFYKSWTHFQSFPCCNRCSIVYKGEQKIIELLESFEIEFKSQYKFDDCYKTKRYKLRFDFYLPEYNTVIEYDGEQHFMPVDFSGKGKAWALNKLKDTKEKDSIKNSYCKNKQIKLIRIPYWDFENIDNVLTKELELFK